MRKLALLCAVMSAGGSAALAAPEAADRVYTADQNSNTVSVIDPARGTLLGQIRLGNPRPDVLSPLSKGEVNVHGLGFSPDGKTVVAISTVTNSASFIDTATNKVKGIAYLGRNPHEGFFTPDGKEVWVTVRGEDHLAVVDPTSFREVGRVPTTSGPGMVMFSHDGRLAFVCNSFNPVVDVIDVVGRKLVRSIPVASPFSPFIQLTPDGGEAWLTHKDVGKVTRIDTASLEVEGVIDTGPITNHLTFARSGGRTLAYVTIGGEDVVKVFTTEGKAEPVATIPVGSLPHGAWTSGDGSRVYVGLENGDAVDVIDTAANRTVARIPVGMAPQALAYVPGAAGAGDGTANLSPRRDVPGSVSVRLAPVGGKGAGYVVARDLGLIDVLEVNLSKLVPDSVYRVYSGDPLAEVAALRTDPKGMATASVIGPLRRIAPYGTGAAIEHARIVVMQGEAAPDPQRAALASR